VVILTGTVVGVVVIGFLYWAQAVLIPVALAVFLTFLLAPFVSLLQRHHVGRVPAVVLVVLVAALTLGGVGWLVTAEVTNVVGELPTYTENIKAKVRSLREMGQGAATESLEKMIRDISSEWASPAKSENVGPVVSPPRPAEVTIQPDSPAWMSRLPVVLSSLVQLLGGLALALVLVVFMLLKREALRDRLIRLVGNGRLTVTTKALEDAGQRISRFLVVQLIINAGFGLVLALGLLLIQVPHALLWGFLAALLRYVPYLGSTLTALLLVTLSLAVFPGWVQPLLVLGLIVGLDLLTGNVLEPRLYGHTIAVSEVALLVAAAFWTFLWGPVGLLLSSPLTVCLAVLGKYVPQMEFLDVLLGDEPALDADVGFYQRLLARDQDEAAQLVLTQARTSPSEEVYDKILVPALNYLKRDRERDDVTEADEEFILRATREVMEDVGERQAASGTPTAEEVEGVAPCKVRLLGCPGRDTADVLALDMLRQLLDPTRWEVEVLSLDLLSAELVAVIGEKAPAVVCLGALPPGGLAHTRYLCKRLRARLPGARIVVGRWGLKGNVEQNELQLREAGADQIETTLLDTRIHLSTWLPVLTPEGPTAKVKGTVGNGQKVTV
jgi:predicted PurR-regulated permease PerM